MAKNKKAKVIIAMPCQRFVFGRTMFALAQALIKPPFDFDFIMAMGADIAGQRTDLVNRAKAAGGSHILFIDYDMYFPPWAIPGLLKQDKDIIGASYNLRKDPPQDTAIPLEEAATDKPFKCRTMGAGLLLIKLSIFDKLEGPWFQFGRDSQGNMQQGEDTHFCYTARAAGFDVWADPTLGVKHVGEYLY